MKKSLLILAAATAVGFAACTGGNNDGSLTPAQLDSIKQVTADSILNAQKLQSDSIANAQNALAVDSLKRINDSLATVAGKPVPVAPTPGKKPSKPSTNKPAPSKEEPTTTPPKKAGLKGESDQEKQKQQGGLKSHSDQAKQEQQRRTGGLKSESDQAKQGE